MTETNRDFNQKERLARGLKLADDTRDVRIADGALSEIAPFFRKNFGDKKPFLVSDPEILRAVGLSAFDSLKDGVEALPAHVFPSGIHAEMSLVDALRQSGLFDDPNAIPVAVGSGTVNDLVKYASSLYGKPYLIVGTAASMDGFTSFGASIEKDHCKQTFNCPAPRAVLLDVAVAAAAPEGMSASGYADLAAKIPAGADWLLADQIGTEPIDWDAWGLVQDGLRGWLADPLAAASRSKTAVGDLLEGLIFSGLAMQKAKSSRTASGAEHQFSHLLDNERHTFQGKTPSHGFKVGIGTISTLALYEKVLQWDESVFDRSIRTLDDHYQPWKSLEALVRASFSDPGLVEASLKQCRLKFTDRAETLRRLEVFRSEWPRLKQRIADKLIPASKMKRMIHDAGAPSTPEEIGISRERLETCYVKARLLRCRYNVLDLVADVGRWTETVGGLFQPGGFWAYSGSR